MTKLPLDTEGKIKEAARKIFHEKGFAAARTRDIAEEAGINLALLNYYFRSKRKLFDMIMMETIQVFFSGIMEFLNDPDTSLHEKLSLFVSKYIDILSDNPDMPSFIMNEVRANPNQFAEKIGVLEKVGHSVFLTQFSEAVQKGVIPPLHPLHFMMNLAGLVVFPFIASPMLEVVTGVERPQILEIIEERKRLIPLWIDAMLAVK